ARIIMTSARELLREGARLLTHEEARREAELLFEHVLGVSSSWLFAHGDEPVDDARRDAYLALVKRRAEGEPVAYLTGQRGFWSMDLDVTPATLIPRPETELLVEKTLERLPPDVACKVADLGTGSGAVALAIAHDRPQAHVTATDASAEALSIAERNSRRLALTNMTFLQGDWMAPLVGSRFDLIASNPPYVASGDAHLAQGDLRFEPSAALASGVDGLDAIRIIVRDAPAHLADGGWLLLEHGWDQAE